MHFYLVVHTPHTPNRSFVIAFKMGSTEFNADTSMIVIDLMMVEERPTKRKRRLVEKSNVKDARRRMMLICNNLENSARPRSRCRTPSMLWVTEDWNLRPEA